ncbi:Ger(x)C family spore germination protein [Ectobacillus sp. JY-23]|uniref:Ger(x)C family spore germination protein n=1 Tax=Ectobacillus sp. JY-23 TaxID=2933872 RepID=UPI001FF49486|nr:Ger(x)C family spore germination protein [Ectobacillus sp. JY-23]UOY91850.1 Ger(x)C family spore germination protein [Ectobacillus sp. JY-23]
MKKVVLFVLCCMMISGCAGLKNIQDLTYIIAIGLDYDENKKEYIAYLQGLNFVNVAKQEGKSSANNIPNFIGSARGETLNLAVSKLYKLTDPPLFFGHIRTIVVTNRLTNSAMKKFLTEVGRNRSVRGTIRLFITEEKIEDVFQIQGLFNYPSVYTVLFKESGAKIFKDEIQPVSLMQFLRTYYEPMGIAKLPAIKINHKAWKSEGSYPTVFIDGYSVFQNSESKGMIGRKDAFIIDWILGKNNSYTVRIEKDDKLIGVVDLGSPKMKVKYEKETDYPVFSIQLSVQGELIEKIEHISYKDLLSKIEKEITNQIYQVYEKGRKQGIDSLNVGENWYRKHPQKYHTLQNQPSFYLHKDSLKKIKVEVEVVNFNSYIYDKNTR